jgi:hypothetical protein
MEYTYRQLIDTMTGLVNPNMIERLPDAAFIPNDPENTDWQAYQEWLAAGNTPLPPQA